VDKNIKVLMQWQKSRNVLITAGISWPDHNTYQGAISKGYHLPWHFGQGTPPQRGGER
jgi:hypothetical protein